MMSKVSPLVGLIIALNLGSLGLVTAFVVVTSSRSGEPSRSARQFPQTAEDVVRLLIADPDHFRRDAAAIRSLQALGKSSIPPLPMALEHSSAHVRATSAWMIEALHPPTAAAAVPGLIIALRDHSQSVRENAAQALGAIGPAAAAAIPALKRTRGAEPMHDIVRVALERIQGEGREYARRESSLAGRGDR